MRLPLAKPQFGVNFTIFVLFFGVSLLNAFGSHHWRDAALWLIGAALFLAADMHAAKRQRPTPKQPL